MRFRGDDTAIGNGFGCWQYLEDSASFRGVQSTRRDVQLRTRFKNLPRSIYLEKEDRCREIYRC